MIIKSVSLIKDAKGSARGGKNGPLINFLVTQEHNSIFHRFER